MKDITIENFLKNLKNALDTSQVEVIDLWEADTCAIGIKKENKMIYISTYNYLENEPIRYDFDFEIINKNKLEVIKERRGVTEKELLNEINIFLGLKNINTQFIRIGDISVMLLNHNDYQAVQSKKIK